MRPPIKNGALIFVLLAVPVAADVAGLSPTGPYQTSLKPVSVPLPLLDDRGTDGVAEPEAYGFQPASCTDIGMQLGLSGCDVLAPAGLVVTGSTATHEEPAVVLEPTPGSPSGLMMALSGLLTLGGWQLTRSVRNAHFHALPDWYHPGGPAQVGHTLAYDLELTPLPACCFQQPPADPLLVHHAGRDLPACRAPSQISFIPAAPRGPPLRPSTTL